MHRAGMTFGGDVSESRIDRLFGVISDAQAPPLNMLVIGPGNYQFGDFFRVG